MQSSLSVNTDEPSEAPQPVSDEGNSNSCQGRITSRESEVVASGEDEEHKFIICTDNKSQPHVKGGDDKWKPVIEAGEKDKLLMPPPGHFLRPPGGFINHAV